MDSSSNSPRASEMPTSSHSTPTRTRERSPITLTPRSKVAALLKDFADSDSDSDSGQTTVKKPATLEKPTTPPVVAEVPTNDDDEKTSDGDDEDEDDDEVPVFAPRGKMAQRMQGRVQKNAHKDEVEEEDSDEDIPVSRKKQTTLPSSDDDEEEQIDDENDDEEDVIAPTRRIIRKSQASAPTNADSEDESDKEASRPATPPSSGKAGFDASEDELPKDLLKSNNFLALVEKKRAERLAKEAAEEEKRKKRMEEEAALFGDSNETDEDEDEIDDKLTQSTKGKSRPVRKATKKALFEMQRETQRMARNTELNVVPEVAKKHSLQSFFDVFNYKPQTGTIFAKPLPTPPASSSPPCAESAANAAAPTAVVATETEESNPFIVDDDEDNNNKIDNNDVEMDSEDELPTIDELMAIPKTKSNDEPAAKDQSTAEKDGGEPAGTSNTPAKKLDKGKAKATPEDLSAEKIQKPIHRIPVPLADDSDSDDLEIVRPVINLKGKSFNSISAKSSSEPKALHDLRRLAGVNSREDSEQFGAKLRQKQETKSLLMRSREQARQAEEEKKAELRAKGHYVPTAEELLQDKKAAEDIWEKHQAQAQAIREREKKDEAREKGVRVSDLTDDSENDSDWLEEADGGNGDEDDDVELSGSEDEDADAENESEEEEEEEDEPTSAQGTPRLSDMPETFIADEADISADESEDGDAPVKKSVRRKRAAVIDDESDNEDGVQVKSSMPEALPLADLGTPPPMMGLTQMFNGSMPSQVVQASPKGDGARSEALPLAGLGTQDMPMGLTQMFEASMAEPLQKKNNMDLLRQTQDEIELPQHHQQPNKDDNDAEDKGETQFPINLDFSQSQIQYEPESLVPDFYPSQMSQIPPPTPDTGFQSHLAPAPPRFDSPRPEEPTQAASNRSGETVATMPMSAEDEPRQKKGRLVRRLPSAEEEAEEKEDKEPKNAFSVMKKAAAARPVDDFDKSKSHAKEMIEEVAEESEDEYAGLGGRSDDEDDDDASEIENLINDEDNEKVNEREVAGLFRKMEGEDDLKNVQDLMKRLENGGLKRRRAGGLFDLSDSEDEVERRVRARRRKEARLRNELLKESGISEIANNPKQSAFFTTLEQREESHFLDQEELYADPTVTRRPLEPTSANNSVSQDTQEDGEADSAAKKRRRAKAKSIADVKRSVSNLLDGHSASLLSVEEAMSSDDEEGSTMLTFKKRRIEIDDRMAMKRATTMTSETTRMAFSSVSIETKLPALLRRSTTSQLSEVSQSKDKVSTSTTSTRASAARGSASINWCQREDSRRKLVEKHNTDRKTEQKKMMGKRRQGISGIMAQGGFS